MKYNCNLINKPGVRFRKQYNISLIFPFELPIPPSYGMSKLLLKTFQKYGIKYIPEIIAGKIESGKKLVILDDGSEFSFDLFLDIPEQCVPKMLNESGLIFDKWIPVDKKTLKPNFRMFMHWAMKPALVLQKQVYLLMVLHEQLLIV